MSISREKRIVSRDFFIFLRKNNSFPMRNYSLRMNYFVSLVGTNSILSELFL